MQGLARLCRSFELASLEKGYVKKALDAYDEGMAETFWI